MAKKKAAETEEAAAPATLEVGASVSIPCKVVEVGEDLVTLETDLPGSNGEHNRFAVHANQLVWVESAEGDKE